TFGVLPYIGYSQDLGALGPGFEDLVVSLAVTAPNLYGATLPSNAPTAYFFLDGYFISISPLLALGYRVNDWLSIGGHVTYNYLRLKYSQRFSITDLLLSEEPTAEERATAESARLAIGDVDLD